MRSVRSLVRAFVRSFKVSFILLPDPACKYTKYTGRHLNWENAKSNCESHGLTLAHFSTKQDAIDAASTSCVDEGPGDSKFWVGLKRDPLSALFSWSDDESTQFPFSAICPGELFNVQSCDVADEQLCYYMVQMQDGKHYLQREMCSRKQYYICQGERTKVWTCAHLHAGWQASSVRLWPAPFQFIKTPSLRVSELSPNNGILPDDFP